MIKVEKFIPGGQSLGTMEDGKKIFFWNALPGEEVVSFETTKTKSHFVEAIATNINNRSSCRATPKDDCFLSTSPWQILNYDYELLQKQNLVQEIFREHSININLPEIITDNRDYYYRNKMEYALYWDKESSKIKLAFHTRGSHQKIPILSSSIERSELFLHAKEIIDELNEKHEEARKYQSMLLRCNQEGKVSGGLFENGHPHPEFNSLSDVILGYKYTYSPNGFFQINLPVYELTLKEIKKHISTDNVLDLYAGVGTIGLSVARDHNLTLVECDKNAYKELVKNCEKGVFEGIRSYDESKRADPVTTGVGDAPRKTHPFAILSKSEEALSYITSDQTVIVDPPRAGCNSKLVNRLLEITPPIIIYLSCNPATQARDVKALLLKYHIKDIKTFNFFPHTPHIENLIVLSL